MKFVTFVSRLFPKGPHKIVGGFSSYFDYLTVEDYVPLFLPYNARKEMIEKYLKISDRVIFQGGPDIGINEKYDAGEFDILKIALQYNVPVLGICRGLQMINVLLGGTLYEDIGLYWSNEILGKHYGYDIEDKWHNIKILKNENNFLYEVYREENIEVNSNHHQAIRDFGKGVIPLAVSDEGIVEAITLEDNPNVIGVQWHPERMYNKTSADLITSFYRNLPKNV